MRCPEYPRPWGLLIQDGKLESGHGMGGAKMGNTGYREPCEGVVFGPQGLSKVNVIVRGQARVSD